MSIQFKMTVRCEKAGRNHNEDDFLICNNLSNGSRAFTTDEVIVLNEKGALFVVCDGMGGMNAGEIASQIAIESIHSWFAPDNLSVRTLASPETVMQFITEAIETADARIKEEGKHDKSREGMGTTIVLAWLLGEKVYIGWCGDSRAYRFNPVTGLEQLSHDHSYVQELVDAGKLTEELAFDHPDSNLITRSLGDVRQKAHPDVAYFSLCNEDILLLCSDGLSGVLRNAEIEAIMARNTGSMGNCRDALWNASEMKGWQDNVTVALCQIVSGNKNRVAVNAANREERRPYPVQKKKLLKMSLPVLLLSVLLAFAAGYIVIDRLSLRVNSHTYTNAVDSVIVTRTESPSIQNQDTVIPAEDRHPADKNETKSQPKRKVSDSILNSNSHPIIIPPDSLTLIQTN